MTTSATCNNIDDNEMTMAMAMTVATTTTTTTTTATTTAVVTATTTTTAATTTTVTAAATATAAEAAATATATATTTTATATATATTTATTAFQTKLGRQAHLLRFRAITSVASLHTGAASRVKTDVQQFQFQLFSLNVLTRIWIYSSESLSGEHFLLLASGFNVTNNRTQRVNYCSFQYCIRIR